MVAVRVRRGQDLDFASDRRPETPTAMTSAQQPGDPNMALALHFARSLGPASLLPESLQRVERRAELVHRIDAPLVEHLELFHVVGQIATRVRDIIRVTPEFMPDVENPIDRLNIALRLWSGCLAAAKTIAYETRSGPNDAVLRARIMLEVDAIAREDPIYAAGVESAPAFKRLRGQGYSLEGVPEESPVRRYP